MQPLHIALIWHMHQPLYKDHGTGEYFMPWVRLHAIKDYLDMAVIIEDYPRLKQTFNLVPSLIEQVQDYATGKAVDRYWALSQKPVAELTRNERSEIVQSFFDLNWDQMLYRHPRYRDIAHKREWLYQEVKDYHYVGERMTDQEILDLTVWFHLAWFDPMWWEQDETLKALLAKGQDFTEDDRRGLFEAERSLIARIIPTYRRLQDEGKIEITTTPYYHPILPLLVDSEAVKVARPHAPLPRQRFMHPEDAARQLRKGVAHYETLFGRRPRGLWPSEQSVSPAILPLIGDTPIQWIISDEGILAATQKKALQRDSQGLLDEPSRLYQPYRLSAGDRDLAIVFRDIALSDLIGFHYSKNDPREAAHDLYRKLKKIQEKVGDREPPALVTIALDGENCWEHYTNDGHDFLKTFYRLLNDDETLVSLTVEDHIEQYPPTETLENLHAGSWIYSDFTTWIGEPTKNRAWDLLAQTRDDLVGAIAERPDMETIPQAWEEIDIAEGSDWFWWFGEGHSSSHDALFDWQFRHHLANVYRLTQQPVPPILEIPVSPDSADLPMIEFLRRRGWVDAHAHEFAARRGTMHQSTHFFSRIYYGFDRYYFRVRVDYAHGFEPRAGESFVLLIDLHDEAHRQAPMPFRLKGTGQLLVKHDYAYQVSLCPHDGLAAQYYHADQREWKAGEEITSVQYFDDAFEIAIPHQQIHFESGKTLSMLVAAAQGDQIVEMLPEPVEIMCPHHH